MGERECVCGGGGGGEKEGRKRSLKRFHTEFRHMIFCAQWLHNIVVKLSYASHE